MKLIKKAGAITLATVFIVLANIPPVAVSAEDNLPADVNNGGGRTIYYEVEKGDCLWTLAQKFGVSVSALTEANGLNEDSMLAEGQQLLVLAPAINCYTVRPGDTLWGIARKFGITVEVLAAANNLSSPDALAVDKELIIPESDPVLRKNEDYAPEAGDMTVEISGLTVWPVTGQVSSEFGERWGRNHEGLDIAAESGKPIRALESGTVVFAGRRGAYGKTVILNHGHGLRSLYAHASSLEVNPGEYVEQGQTIARIGSTGHSTGPHLHLEILYRGMPLNPEQYLPTEDGRI